MHRYAVIMAGGSGERFWPLSRKHRPKQLLKLTSTTETLLEEAVRRIEPLIGIDRVIIATTPHLEESIRSARLVAPSNVIAEPDKRNTLGCLAWAAGVLASREGGTDVSMAVLTADHKIGNRTTFRQTVSRALSTAEDTGSLVTIGVVPTRPETGYGYIEFDDSAAVGGGWRVKSFREKPDLESAQKFVEAGSFLWNSGMFFWTLDAFYGEIAQADSAMASSARDIASCLSENDTEGAEAAFQRLPSKSIDYALMEKARQVAVVPAEFAWDDVGAWDALERSIGTNSDGNVLQGRTVLIDAADSIVYNENPDQTVAMVGVHDVVVVVTKDAILVCPKGDAQRVKEIVGQLPGELL